MTYLHYKEINVGEGVSVDLEYDVAQANEQRATAARAFLRACARQLPDILSNAAAKMARTGVAPKPDLARH